MKIKITKIDNVEEDGYISTKEIVDIGGITREFNEDDDEKLAISYSYGLSLLEKILLTLDEKYTYFIKYHNYECECCGSGTNYEYIIRVDNKKIELYEDTHFGNSFGWWDEDTIKIFKDTWDIDLEIEYLNEEVL